jgi:hypothetical protein
MGQFVKKEISHGVDEVTFKNHISEFQRFYSNHKGFCDEVAGLKKRAIQENGETREFYITKENFIFAIRRLLSFVVDNLHYIKRIQDLRNLEKSCYELEERFLSDSIYQSLSNKSRNPSEEIELSKRHIIYIKEIYEIGNTLVGLLQNSIMLSTSRISKDIEYHNESSFFDELSKYRTEISDSLSNYRFSDTLTILKKILGYHYTYKILLQEEDQIFIKNLLDVTINEILQENIVRLITKVANNDHLRQEDKELVQTTHNSIKKVLLKIYYITNKNLSERKVLPKIMRKIYVDKTLI